MYLITGRCTASTYIFEIGTGRVKAKEGATSIFKLRYHQLYDQICFVKQHLYFEVIQDWMSISHYSTAYLVE